MKTNPQYEERAAAVPNSLASDPELMGDFILESREHLGTIELQLLTLEHDPTNAEAIHTIFRGFHTIKGLAGFLELAEIQAVAHEVETVLDRARNGALAINPRVIDCILESKDYLAQAMGALEGMLEGGQIPDMPDNTVLLATIQALAEKDSSVDPIPAATADLQALSSSLTSGKMKIPEPETVPTTLAPPSAAASRVVEPKAIESKLIKVETAKLDFLVEMVGEMMIAQSLVKHDPELACESKPRLARNLAQLARITEEVQKTAMSMRMVPIVQLFQKMSRLVRDLSKKAGKQVELELVGEETELDRHIVEEVADPLMHMVRNAIDHGIEPPDERIRAGKNPMGRLTLKAGHQAGHILIHVSDDGRGLPRAKILTKARKNGLIDPAADPTDQEVFNLIFHPGFSTAEKVTDVSGRGVGMDVVKKHVQKLRGRIDIESEEGHGTAFSIKLPLTLAIIDGLVVGVGAERYVVPIYAVREMLRPSPEMISTVQGRSEMVLVRGRLIPIVRLHDRFAVQPRSVNPCEGVLIIAESDQKRFALLVDHLVGKQEVVIKSLGATLQGIAGVAGGAILGDGKVGLILDLEGLYDARRSD